MQTLLKSAFDVTKVYPRKKDNQGEEMILTVEVSFTGTVALSQVGFLFGVLDPEDTNKLADPLTLIPGFWSGDANPTSDAKITFTGEFDECEVEIFEKLADNKAPTNELVSQFGNCKVSGFSLIPNHGHTVNLDFKIFANDVEGETVGDIADKIKGGVYVKVARKDLLDKVEDAGK